MPNIRRTFPGSSRTTNPVDDDDDDEEEEENYQPVFRGGGKQFGGGKGLRPVEQDNDDDDDSDDSESDDEPPPPTVPVNRGSGKQFGGGKYLRPSNDDDDDENADSDEDEDEDDEQASDPEPQPIRVVPRGGGKNLIRPIAQEESEGDSDEDEEEEEDDDDEEEVQQEAPAPTPTYPAMNRGGGKSLARMAPSAQESEDSDDDSDEEVEDDESDEPATKSNEITQSFSSGKQMRRPEPEPGNQMHGSSSIQPSSSIVPTKVTTAQPMHSGKQIRLPQNQGDGDEEEEEDDDDEEEEEEEEEEDDDNDEPVRPIGSGKLLRPPERESNDPVSTSSMVPQLRQGGGKQLRPSEKAAMDDDDDDDDDEDEDDEEDEDLKDTKVPTSVNLISTADATIHRGGKTLHRSVKDDDEDEDDDDEDEDDDDEDEEEPDEPVKPLPSKAPLVQEKKTQEPFHEEEDEEEEEVDEPDYVDDEISSSDDGKDDDDYEEVVSKKSKAKAKPKPKEKAKPKPKSKPKQETSTQTKSVKSQKDVSKAKVVDDEIVGDDDMSDEEVELDMNNTDGLIKDEADRIYLDSLPELDREAILAERFEKHKAELDMKKAIREAKRKEDETKGKSKDDKGKEKPYTEADEDLAKSLAGRRSSVRERDATGAKSKKLAALALLKKERKIQQDIVESSGDSEMDFGDDDEDSDEDYDDEGGEKPWQKKTKLAAGKSSVSRLDQSDESGEDMDIDDDDEDAQPKGSRKAKDVSDEKSALNARHEDFVKVTIPRRRLQRWCNEPFFQAAVLECYVRVLIGENDSGEKVYRLCEIVDVKITSKSYKFPVADKNAIPVSTNKMLRLKFGTSEKDFPMYLVSDAPPTETDVEKYLTAQKNNRLEILSKRRAAKLRRLQDELVSNYTYTTADIEKNLQRRKRQGKSTANLGIETTRLAITVRGAKDAVAEAEQQLADAKKALLESSGNPAEESALENKVHDCTDALKAAKKFYEEKLEEERVMLAAVQERKQRLTKRQKDANWKKVNERAVQTNQLADREGYKALKEAEMSKFNGKKDEFNPYARRPVKPKVLWKVDQGAVEEVEVKLEEKKDANDVVVKLEQPSDTSSTPSLVPEPLKAAAVSESHQFAIDEEDLVQGNLGILGRSHLRKRKRARRGISLKQYLDMKEQGTL